MDKNIKFYEEHKEMVDTIDLMLANLKEFDIVGSFDVEKGKLKNISILTIDDEEEEKYEFLFKGLLETVFKMPIFKEYRIIVDYEQKVLLITKENKKIKVNLKKLDEEFDVFKHLGKEILHQLKIAKTI